VYFVTVSITMIIVTIFCNSYHYNDNCDKFTTISERKSQLTAQGRRFICFRADHLCKECPSKSCYYCNRTGYHHRSICLKQFGRAVYRSFIEFKLSK